MPDLSQECLSEGSVIFLRCGRKCPSPAITRLETCDGKPTQQHGYAGANRTALLLKRHSETSAFPCEPRLHPAGGLHYFHSADFEHGVGLGQRSRAGSPLEEGSARLPQCHPPEPPLGSRVVLIFWRRKEVLGDSPCLGF